MKVRLEWEVSNLETLLNDGYDFQKVQREDAGPVWVDVTPATNRVPLVANVPRGVFHDLAGDTSKGYQVVYYRSSDDTDHPTPLAITSKTLRGYCTVADMVAEGFTDPPYAAARVQVAIDRATAQIDRICRQWFEPRFRTLILDAKHHPELSLDVAICAVIEVRIDGAAQTLGDYAIYNRHLTHGMDEPDDRFNPLVAYQHEQLSRVRDVYRPWAGRFPEDIKVVEITGVFGFTELGEGQIGETAAGSQVPLTYGGTPEEIKRACMLLSAQHLPTIESGEADEFALRKRITSQKTRDQSYTLQSGPTEDAAYGLTGDIEVDGILMAHAAPLGLGSV